MTLGMLVGLAASAGAVPSPYELVWDSPSEDSNGTVPLGNGEIGLNAWIEPSGDLRFYISRTDTWDEYGRLLKVGAVRIRVGDGSPKRTKTFRQVLRLKEGALVARYGEGDAQVDLRLWVDANRPVICVEARTPKPSVATATAELWRTKPTTLPSVECSDIYNGRPDKTVVEPDTVLTGLKDRVGWYHRNVKSIGPELCAKIQGVADFPRPDPLLHRTFGALIAADRPERVDDRTLRSGAGERHLFEIAALTKRPATADEWLAATTTALDAARAVPLEKRRAAHAKWWAKFWNRSWIHITENGAPAASGEAAGSGPLPANKLPVRIGMDQGGGSRFDGTLGRVGIYEGVLKEDEIRRLADTGPEEKAGDDPACVYSAVPEGPKALPELAGRAFAKGVTIEAWIKPAATAGGMRLVDKITPGGSDGFLLDTHPGTDLRLIAGAATYHKEKALIAGKWQHVAATIAPDGAVRLYYDGARVAASPAGGAGNVTDGGDAFIVTRAYALQRYVSACAGRGRYPIKFNGSIFTVPFEGGPGDADYRRWGPGYWWQNTRLPYYSMCASGDFDMMRPLFRMYAQELMPLFTFRTRRYLGHDGAYIPECIYFWGDMFTETYGWQPAEERQDKLQASRWHKWEWVSGLELSGLLLDCYDFTQDAAFLKETALPAIHEVLTFFDQQYPVGPDGKLVMHPAQALETWWDCTNPMPEVAGLHAICGRVLALPAGLVSAEERAFCRQLQAKLPPLPTRRTEDNHVALAPAQEYKQKSNIENPELYAVFPFRQISFEKPHADWGVEALHRRLDRGPQGWRQEDIFMAYLGLADEARDYVVRRARSKNAASRFPAFWGPNYDWTPDQDHGSVLLKGVQSLLMQTDGRHIYLLPAWPKDWDADFRLHAPYRTTVTGKVAKGKLVRLEVQPPARSKDVKVCGGALTSRRQ